jgi:hypothetical protein
MKQASRLGEGMRNGQAWHGTDCQPIVSRRSIRERQVFKREKTLGNLVGAEGFEPPTLCSQSRCATRLRYAPTQGLSHSGRLPRRACIGTPEILAKIATV